MDNQEIHNNATTFNGNSNGSFETIEKDHSSGIPMDTLTDEFQKEQIEENNDEKIKKRKQENSEEEISLSNKKIKSEENGFNKAFDENRIEKLKIHCAGEHFKEISNCEVKFAKISSYEKLLDIVQLK